MLIKRLPVLVLMVMVAAPALAVKPGDTAPAWEGSDFSGKVVEFPQVADGKPTVLVFWATWCSYCKAFMPYLSRIQSDYGTDRISVVAVNTKQARAKDGDPKAYVDGLGFPMTAIRDGDSIAATYNVKFIPGLMVVDGNGVVVYRRRSTDLPAGKTVAELWSDEVRQTLDKLGSENLGSE